MGDDFENQTITTAQAALLFGLSVRRIQQLVEVGTLKLLPGGGLNLIRAGQAYCRFLRDETRRANPTPELRRMQVARARSIELDVHLKEGRLMDVEEGIDRLAQCLGAFKYRVLSVPARMTSDPQLRRQWEAALTSALDEAVHSFIEPDEDEAAEGREASSVA